MKGVKRYWPCGLTLTFEHVTWKSIGIIYSLRATPAPSLILIKWRGQKILSGQHSKLRRVVWPWPWTCDLEINKDQLLIEGKFCTKFCNDQVKRSKDIERTTLGLQTDRPTVAKQYAPFFKGGIKRFHPSISTFCIYIQYMVKCLTLFLGVCPLWHFYV